ncbi:hypothetical protein F444_22594, partial [Phytophthora nicotianae P1976]
MSQEKIKTNSNVAGGQQPTFTAFGFAWYAQEPRTWQSAISKQQKADAKLHVASMKLFLSDGFVLDTTVPDYRDRVVTLGKHAVAAVLEFLVQQMITSRGAGAVLKHLRILHRCG